MLNQVVIVGRLVKELEVKELESGKVVSNITLAVPRSFKNAEGIYETDFIECTLWNGVAENTAEYCHKGDLLGVKGRLETKQIETENDGLINSTIVIAEKITFLNSKKTEE